MLVDSWYATKELMLQLHRAHKFFYCPLTSNRKIDDSGAASPYTAGSELQWSEHDAVNGKLIKVHGFPGTLKVKLFQVATTTSRTKWMVTNDIDPTSTDDARSSGRLSNIIIK